MSSPPAPDDEKNDEIRQKVASYTRNVKLVEMVCANPNCAHCSNIPIKSHVNRRYCSEAARLAHRKLKRAQRAIEEGREPGRVGRPRKRR